MKNKRFKKFLLTCTCLVSLLGSTSCASFFGGGNEGYSITDTSVTTNENGDTIVTLTFNSEDIDPLTFTIPASKDGADGNGIASITSKIEDQNVVLTIKYTDTTKKDTVVSFPLLKGDTGNGIKEVIYDEDEEGNTTFRFIYTDGTESEEITIPKGDNGIGISNVISETLEDGSTHLVISFTDDLYPPVDLTIKDGVSISDVSYNAELSTDEVYVLEITYTDGNKSRIELPRPQTNVWHNGTTKPASDIGKVGDYYINMATGDVYTKTNAETWMLMFSIKGEATDPKERFNVFFNLREDETYLEMPSGSQVLVVVTEGETVPLSSIPIPQKDGYTFIGWYAGEDESNPNVGKFDNLTPVTSDLTLYARWTQN